MPQIQQNKLFAFLILGIIPILLWYLRLDIIAARGPFWIGYNADPAYGYLLNSLNVAFYNGGIGRQLLHPGIPIYFFGATIIFGLFVYRFVFENLELPFNEGIQTDVLQNPEVYLSAINFSAFFLNIVLLYAVSWLVYKYSKKISYALVIQALPLYSEVFLTESFAKVSAEFMLMAASILLLGYIVISLLKNGQNALKYTFLTGQGKKYTLSYDALWMGIFCGFGLSVKLPFIAYWIMPVIIIWKRREVVKFMAVAISTFILWMTPVLFRFYIPLKFWFDITAHSGNYGTGEVSLINLGDFFKNLSTIITTYPFIPIALILFVILGGLLLKKNDFKLKMLWQNRTFRVFIALFIGLSANLVMVSKHYQNRYLLTFFCILPFLIIVALLLLKNYPLANPKSNNLLQVVLFGLPFLCAIFSFSYWQTTRNNFLADVQQRTLAYEFIQKEKDNYIPIYKYGSSDKRYALKFGDGFARSLNEKKLSEIYGSFYQYNFTYQQIFNWNKEVSPAKLLAFKKDILIIGNSEYLADIEKLFNRKVILFKDFGVEKVYKIELKID